MLRKNTNLIDPENTLIKKLRKIQVGGKAQNLRAEKIIGKRSKITIDKYTQQFFKSP